jgi:hypothetical protein
MALYQKRYDLVMCGDYAVVIDPVTNAASPIALDSLQEFGKDSIEDAMQDLKNAADHQQYLRGKRWHG